MRLRYLSARFAAAFWLVMAAGGARLDAEPASAARTAGAKESRSLAGEPLRPQSSTAARVPAQLPDADGGVVFISDRTLQQAAANPCDAPRPWQALGSLAARLERCGPSSNPSAIKEVPQPAKEPPLLADPHELPMAPIQTNVQAAATLASAPPRTIDVPAQATRDTWQNPLRRAAAEPGAKRANNPLRAANSP